MSSRYAALLVIGIVSVGAATAQHKFHQNHLIDAVVNAAPVDERRVPPLVVRPDASDLRFVWYDDSGAHDAEHLTNIPEAYRDFVRVEPLDPARRTAGEVLVADLRSPRGDRSFATRSLPQDRFAAELSALSGRRWGQHRYDPAPTEHPRHGTQLPPGITRLPSSVARRGLLPQRIEPALGAPVERAPDEPARCPEEPSSGRVVVYGASWCPSCRAAIAWLRQNDVPFTERDIDHDRCAREDLVRVAQRAGIGHDSIPVIDAHGSVLVGFSPEALAHAVGR